MNNQFYIVNQANFYIFTSNTYKILQQHFILRQDTPSAHGFVKKDAAECERKIPLPQMRQGDFSL